MPLVPRHTWRCLKKQAACFPPELHVRQTTLWTRTTHVSHQKLPLWSHSEGKYDFTHRCGVGVDSGHIRIFLRTQDHQKHKANSAFAFANSYVEHTSGPILVQEGVTQSKTISEGHVSHSVQPSRRAVRCVVAPHCCGPHSQWPRSQRRQPHQSSNKAYKHEELGPFLNTLCVTKMPKMGLQELQQM